MIIKGRSISSGQGEGRALKLNEAFSFLGGVNTKTGELSIATEKKGVSLKDAVFAFPKGRGSTVGSYTILDLRKHGNAPAAIINERAETIVATGAVMAKVPMVDSIDLSLICNGDLLKVDGDKGEVEILGVEERFVTTSVMRHGDRVLILKRSDKVGTNKGKWAAVSGFVEAGEAPEQTAKREITEELSISEFRLVKTGTPIHVRLETQVMTIFPFLFDVDSDDVTIDWEHTEHRWIQPDQLRDYDAVTGLDALFRSFGLL